jgi:hypothetical protein
MLVNNNHFIEWMEKLSKKLIEIGKDLKSLIQTNKVFDKDEKLLDNQNLCFYASCKSSHLAMLLD